MQSDLPHTLYLREKKKGDNNAPFKVKKNDKAFALQEEATRQAIERRRAKKAGEMPYTTDELFK